MAKHDGAMPGNDGHLMFVAAVVPGCHVKGAGALAAVGGEAGRIAARVTVLPDANPPGAVLAQRGTGGAAAAHAIHHGLAALPQTHAALHGEKVAFGVLVELALNRASDAEILQLARFNLSVGLPATLAALGITDADAALPAIVARATRPGEIIFNQPVAITPATVTAALCRADMLGHRARGERA